MSLLPIAQGILATATGAIGFALLAIRTDADDPQEALDDPRKRIVATRRPTRSVMPST